METTKAKQKWNKENKQHTKIGLHIQDTLFVEAWYTGIIIDMSLPYTEQIFMAKSPKQLSCSLIILKFKDWDALNFQVFTATIITWCITCTRSYFCSLCRLYRVLFSTHGVSSRSNYNRNFWGQNWLIVEVCTYTRMLPYKPTKIDTQSYLPIYTFIWLSIQDFVGLWTSF